MSGHNKFSWMVKPKGFIKLVGGEYDLMQKAGGTVLFKFYSSSVIILLIAGISFVSIAYAIELLFHAVIVEIMLSLFLSSLFVLLFIFIVNTFTKDARQRRLFNISNITRLGFVMFIGFIISKPIEAFLYRDVIEADIKNHKAELIKGHGLKINQLFSHDLGKLANEKSKYTALNISGGFDADISQIDQQVTLIDQKKKGLATASAFRIEQGAYFIYRIKVISGKYPGAWMISLAIVLLFLAPVFLIYSISSEEEYFKRKNAQEKKIVERAYKAFTQKYADIFLAKYGLKLEFYSKYEDPPFNTLLKKPPPCKSANDFHERYAQA
jgi:hypothetical protein